MNIVPSLNSYSVELYFSDTFTKENILIQQVETKNEPTTDFIEYLIEIYSPHEIYIFNISEGEYQKLHDYIEVGRGCPF